MSVRQITKIALGVTLLWYGVLRGARALVVMLKSWSLVYVDITDMTAKIVLYFLIQNPLVIGLKLKGIVGDVYVQGQNVGHIEHYYNYYLSGLKSHVIPVETILDLDIFGVTMLQNIQAAAVGDIEIAFDGKILVGKYNVPIPVKIERIWGEL